MNIIFQFQNNKMFVKNIICIIFLLFVQSSIGQLDENLIYDDKGNFFDQNSAINPGGPVNFLKLVASTVKGQEKVEKIEEPIKTSMESTQDTVGYSTNYHYMTFLKNSYDR